VEGDRSGDYDHHFVGQGSLKGTDNPGDSMKRKIVDLLMFAIVLVGGIAVWRTGQERSRLGKDYARLVKAAGDFTIQDSSKFHILALDTGEPLHFAWRVYLPPNSRLRLRDSSGGEHTHSGGAGEFIIRLRIREEAGKGRLQVYQNFAGGSNTQSFGDERLAKLLLGHEREIRVEQLGSGGVAVVDRDQSMVLLRLTIPESLQTKARDSLGPADSDSSLLNRFLPDLYLWELGPDSPSPKAASPRK
jgi:hypothetical protein